MSRSYQVRDVARIAGVSVRALHHYHEIGLLVPAGRTEAGYRLYDESDLLRLQQILIGRELGLPLQQIKESLDNPDFDRRRALLEQRSQLARRVEQTQTMLRAVDAALAFIDRQEKTMDPKELFDGFDHQRYEAEAEARWGDTDAYAECAKRTKRYTKEDWQRLGEEQGAIMADAFTALQAGKKPDSDEVMAIAERHRLSIDKWFYPCSPSMHRALADGYKNDARFEANIDRFGKGLTDYLAAAIHANAEQQGS